MIGMCNEQEEDLAKMRVIINKMSVNMSKQEKDIRS